MKTKGKFIILSLIEFETWLNDLHVARKIEVIQQHHTWSPSYQDWFKKPEYFSYLEGMESYHVNNNGWSEIAQNFTTFPDGSIAVCRSIEKPPAGIKGVNQFGICIEHIGNFDVQHDSMSESHKETIVRMTGLLCKKFELVPSSQSIVYHHWFDLVTGKRTDGIGTVKSCPGTNFFGGNSVFACEKNFIPLVKNVI